MLITSRLASSFSSSLPSKVIAIPGLENKVKIWLVRLSGRIFLFILLTEFCSFTFSLGNITESNSFLSVFGVK